MNPGQVKQKNYQMPPQYGFTIAHFLPPSGPFANKSACWPVRGGVQALQPSARMT
jgi:hypothetical protein